jgi:ribosomal protein S18 acetylase RimI-like enzyme
MKRIVADGRPSKRMTKPLVRAAEPSDIEACVELALDATADANVAPTADFWREAFARDIDDSERKFVVAVSSAEIVGYARAHLFDPEPDAPSDTAPSGYYLIGLFVRLDGRRTGLGAALTDVRLRWISERADEAWFFANARNTASIELHRRFGFEEFTRAFSFPGLTFPGGEGILFRVRLR